MGVGVSRGKGWECIPCSPIPPVVLESGVKVKVRVRVRVRGRGWAAAPSLGPLLLSDQECKIPSYSSPRARVLGIREHEGSLTAATSVPPSTSSSDHYPSSSGIPLTRPPRGRTGS